MAKVGTGQLTIHDMNDIPSGKTAPTNPTVGSMWLNTNDFKVYAYDGTSWVLASNEYQFDELREIVEDIQATLGNMANDNILDFKERQLLKSKLNDILGYALADSAVTLPSASSLDSSSTGRGSYYTARSSAINAGILPTDGLYTAVATKYTDLKTYLESLTPIKPWDCTSANSSKVVSVIKATFTDKFMQYYIAVNALASYTTQKLKENVDRLKTGGRNFAVNGDFSIPLARSRWTSSYVGNTKEIVDISTETPPHRFAYHVKNTTAINGGINAVSLWNNAVAESMVGQELTISFWIKYQNIVQGANSWNKGRFGEIIIEGRTSANASVYSYLPVTSPDYITGTNMTWQKVTKTIKLDLPSTATRISNIQVKFVLEGCTGEFWTTGIMIEGGNMPSEWSPNPDDVEARMGDVELKITPDGIFTEVSRSDLFNATLDESQGDYTFENGVSLWKASHDLSASITGVTVISGAGSTGKNVIQMSAEKWGYYGRKIPVETSKTYRVRFRVKMITAPTTGGALIYAGLAGYSANKSPLTTTVFGTHRFCAVSGTALSVTNEWQTFEGIISGEGNDGYNQFIAGTKYVTPVFGVNSVAGNGVVQVDLCEIKDITDESALAESIKFVEQSITPSGITTVIQESQFYGEFLNSLGSKADASDLAENYPTKEDVTSQIDDIDITGKIDLMIDDSDSKLARTYSTKLEVEETARGITEKFSATGGMNMIKNSIGLSDFDFWTTVPATYGTVLETVTDMSLDALGFSSGIKLNAHTSAKSVTQTIPVIPTNTYTLSWYINKTNNSTTSDGNIRIDVVEGEGDTQVNSKTYNYNQVTNGYEADFFTFTPSSNEVKVRIYGYKDSVAIVTGLMMTIGDIALQWSQATGENYNRNVRTDVNGIRVSQLEVDEVTGVKMEKGYTRISPDEFAGYYDINGDGIPDKVFWLNGDELVARRVNAENEFTMGNVKIVNNYGKWAFVPFVR